MTIEKSRQWHLAFFFGALIAIVADWVFFPGDPAWLEFLTWVLLLGLYYFWGRTKGMEAQQKIYYKDNQNNDFYRGNK